MSDVNREFLEKWHAIVREKDVDELGEILADDISMGAPPYWDYLSGKKTVHKLLELIINTIEDFTYHREWHDDHKGQGEMVLEFKGKVGDTSLQGVDLITINDQGELRHLDVMIRPLNALEALRDIVAPQMMEFFTQESEQANKP